MTIPPASKKLHIIYAEDSPPEREMLSALLSERGHSVTSFRDGSLALQGIANGPYDVVITDHDMPRMNGLELVQELQKIKCPAKIVVMSGFLEVEEREQYRSLGVSRFLSKPSPKERILKTVEGD